MCANTLEAKPELLFSSCIRLFEWLSCRFKYASGVPQTWNTPFETPNTPKHLLLVDS